MFWSLSIAIFCLFLFFVHAVVCVVESRRGRRLYASSARATLDNGLLRISGWLSKKITYISRYIITLSWYYSLHALLVVVLRFIAGTYHAVEAVVLRNRDRAKEIRREHRRSHLTDIAEHKEATKLSPKESASRKKQALDGTHHRR